MDWSDRRSQDQGRTRSGSQEQYGDDESRDLETSRRSMERSQDDRSQSQSRSWTGYVVPYRYYGHGYRGVGYYSVMYLGPNRDDESRGEFDQTNVDYGQGQGAGAAWTGGQRRGASMAGGYAGRGPKGYQRSDERIREDINDRLMADDRIDASEIDVKVKNGEVTLTGTVDDRYTKRLAEDVAESVMGVNDVMNQIRVGSRGGMQGSSQGSPSGSAAASSNRRSTRNGARSTDDASTRSSSTTRSQSDSASR